MASGGIFKRNIGQFLWALFAAEETVGQILSGVHVGIVKFSDFFAEHVAKY